MFDHLDTALLKTRWRFSHLSFMSVSRLILVERSSAALLLFSIKETVVMDIGIAKMKNPIIPTSAQGLGPRIWSSLSFIQCSNSGSAASPA